MIKSGWSIDISIDGDDNLLTLAGWCNVFHQSTENLIIGRLTIPTIARIAAGFEPSIFLGNALAIPIYAK